MFDKLSRSVPALLVSAVFALGVSACGGSDAPKISSAEFLSKCKTDLGKSQSGTLSAYQVSQICTCSQKKLVDQGLGDKRTDDESLKDEATQAGRDCATEALSSK